MKSAAMAGRFSWLPGASGYSPVLSEGFVRRGGRRAGVRHVGADAGSPANHTDLKRFKLPATPVALGAIRFHGVLPVERFVDLELRALAAASSPQEADFDQPFVWQ